MLSSKAEKVSIQSVQSTLAGEQIAQITDMPPGSLPPVQIFDVTDKVGWGLRNRVEDVQLVQFAINKLAPKLKLQDFRKAQSNFGPGLTSFAPLAPLVTDGKVGPETANAIKSYQIQSHSAQDNTVDPVYVLLDRLHGDPSGQGFIRADILLHNRVMYKMNLDYLRQYGRIMDENEFPPQLRAEIRHKIQPHEKR